MSYPFFKHRPNDPAECRTPYQDHATTARLLDLMADAELQQGHHARAERLAWRADALRAEVAG